MIEHDVGPAMGELTESNNLLGDRIALDAAWVRDGYWFFRDVLDQDAITGMRRVLTDHLEVQGVTDAGDPQTRWNGADLSHFDRRMEAMSVIRAERAITTNPKINAFFERLFGCAPFWIPITEYRATPPLDTPGRSRFDMIHEDGIFNEGLPFMICWIPLAPIDPVVGGLAVAEGTHRAACLHRRIDGQIHPVDPADVPTRSWKRADYRPGDVLLMGRHTLHSGLSNLSDRFRLSLDTRILPSEANVPLCGTLLTVDGMQMRLQDDAGEHLLAIDDSTYARDLMGRKMRRDEIASFYHPGMEVVVAAEGARAVLMRPQH